VLLMPGSWFTQAASFFSTSALENVSASCFCFLSGFAAL
jgi:hypothetical protein